MDGIFLAGDTTLWVSTNSGNARALKVVANDGSWTKIKEVYASNPTDCATGVSTGPTTGVLVGNYFVTSGGKMHSRSEASLSRVFMRSGHGFSQEVVVGLSVGLGLAVLLAFAAGCYTGKRRERSSNMQGAGV